MLYDECGFSGCHRSRAIHAALFAGVASAALHCGGAMNDNLTTDDLLAELVAREEAMVIEADYKEIEG